MNFNNSTTKICATLHLADVISEKEHLGIANIGLANARMICRAFDYELDRMLEGGMAVSIGRLRPDTQYDYKFVCLSHNTLRGAAGGAVLLAELLCAEGYIDRK